jgi:chromosome segregation ATPase
MAENDNEKESVPDGGVKKTKKQVAFNWIKAATLLGALLSGIYANTNSASNSSVSHVVNAVNDQLIPELQSRLEQLQKDNSQKSERIVRLEVQISYLERMIQQVASKLDHLSRHRNRRTTSAELKPASRKPATVDEGPSLVEMMDAATKDTTQAQKPIDLPKIKEKN